MPPLFLPVTCLVAVALGASIVVLTRAKADGTGENAPLFGTIALVGGTTGLVLQVAAACFSMLSNYGESLPWWLDALLQGIILGSTLYLVWNLWSVVQRISLWACRCPNEGETMDFWLRRHVYSAAALVIVFTAVIAVARLAPSSDWPYNALGWLALLVAISAPPLYQAWALPWFLYYRARRLDVHEHGEIHEWLERVRETHDVPKFHLRVQEGKMVNALATGGVRAYFIVLGRGLLEHLKPQHVKAVLAHEIGHVVNGDSSRRTVPLVLCCAALHLLYYHFVVLQWESIWQRAICAGVGMGVYWHIFPGLIQRRWEYQADRKAVEIMGDAEVVARTLERIYDVNNIHIDAPGWPHPPLRARLKAIGIEPAQAVERTSPSPSRKLINRSCPRGPCPRPRGPRDWARRRQKA